MLKSLYDLDLLEEEGIYAWAEKVRANSVSWGRQSAALLTFLWCPWLGAAGFQEVRQQGARSQAAREGRPLYCLAQVRCVSLVHLAYIPFFNGDVLALFESCGLEMMIEYVNCHTTKTMVKIISPLSYSSM